MSQKLRFFECARLLSSTSMKGELSQPDMGIGSSNKIHRAVALQLTEL